MSGYQLRDHEVIDYELWTHDSLPGLELRGPRPELAPGRYLACLGAAQTFGAYAERPWPALVSDAVGLPALNLGVPGAGPRWFGRHPAAIDLANRGALAVVQVMSGRSEDNRRFASHGRERVTRRRDGVVLGAEPAWAAELRDDPGGVLDLVEETRRAWIESMRRLFAALTVPTILLWFSTRPPRYRARTDDVLSLFGDFPQLIDEATFAAVRPLADEVIACVTARGLPQPLVSRFTGLPVEVERRPDLGGGVRGYNRYYPTPEMHADAARALAPPVRRLLARRTATTVRTGTATGIGSSEGRDGRVMLHRDVLVVPFTHLLEHGRGGIHHRGGPIWPDWDAAGTARHHVGGEAVDTKPEAQAPVRRFSGPAAWAGPRHPHFGHQIAEFGMRLLPTWDAAPGIPILVGPAPSLGRVPRVPGFWAPMLDWLGIPASAIVTVTEPLEVPELIVLPQAEQYLGPGPSPEHLDRMDDHVARRLGEVRVEGTLFVSRAGQGARLAGEAELERALGAAGVRVLRPETAPLADQLRAYRGAERLLVTEGAALCALQLLGRLPAHLIVLNRRPGRRFADANVRPRVPALTWVDALDGLVCGLRPGGREEIAMGMGVPDHERLVTALREVVPGIADMLDPGRFRAAQEEDVLAWLRALTARWLEPPGSRDHLLATLADAGLGRLERAARWHLDRLVGQPVASSRS